MSIKSPAAPDELDDASGARYLPEPDAGEIDLVAVLRALADPVRLRLAVAVSDGDYHLCGPNELFTGLHKSTVSHHKKVLREAGVVHVRLVGRNYYMALRRTDLDHRFPGLIDAVLTSAPVAA